MSSSLRVVVTNGARTPFVKAGTQLAGQTALDLSIALVEAYWRANDLSINLVDELVWSTVLHDPRVSNLGREIVLRSQIDKKLSAHTVSNNCISGLLAIAVVSDAIKSGRIRSGLCGGVESMSRPPLLFSETAQNIFLKMLGSKSGLFKQLKTALDLRPRHFFPTPPSPKEPSTGKTMGEHCEIMAKEWQIKRTAQDEWACSSHMKAHNSVTSGKINNIVSVAGVTKDGIIRGSTTTAKLSELLPVFDRSGTGTLTAGNSSALTDGASLVHLVSEKMASNNPQCTALAYIDDIEFAAVPPSDGLLMAPTLALPRLLARNNLTLDDIDYFEIHEAFAAQVLCTLKAWQDGWAKYPSCQLGQIDPAKINVRGGSLAYGHPFAATGARLVFNLAQLLAESPNNNSRGIISVCAAGGMGACVLMSKA